MRHMANFCNRVSKKANQIERKRKQYLKEQEELIRNEELSGSKCFDCEYCNLSNTNNAHKCAIKGVFVTSWNAPMECKYYSDNNQKEDIEDGE